MTDRSYGAITRPMGSQNSLIDATHEERAALLPTPDKPGTIVSHLQNHAIQRVDRSWADLILLGGYLVTGLLDSSSTFVWGSFVSMQTGNTVYLGLGIVAPHESSRWIRAAISIGSFCFGSTVFALYHRNFGKRIRWVIVSSYLLQLLCVIAAALVVTLGPPTSSSDPVTVWVALPLALLAFQAAGQAVESRALEYSSLTGVVLTSIYCDLFSDQQIFAGIRQNVDRNRRAAAPTLLLIGAILGGVFAHSSLSMSGAIWTAVGLKALIILTWIIWPKEKAESA